MPVASRIAIRLALAWLLLGMGMGVLVVCTRAGLVPVAMTRAIAVHIPGLLFGFFAQLVLGVAHWMMPKYKRGDPRAPRGDERPFMAGVITLNLGVACTAAGALFGYPPLHRIGAVGVALALALCASRIWPRIKAFGS